MKQHKIRAVHAKKFVVTTDSKHNYPVAEHKLDGDFTAEAPGKKWVSDITYIRTGNCWDNAVAERSFKTLKVEHVYRYRFADREQAGITISEWIETGYNQHRRHSALGNLSITEFNEITQIKYAA